MTEVLQRQGPRNSVLGSLLSSLLVILEGHHDYRDVVSPLAIKGLDQKCLHTLTDALTQLLTFADLLPDYVVDLFVGDDIEQTVSFH